MKGLFIKDLCNIRQLLTWYGVMAILFVIATVTSGNPSFMMGFGVFITISTASSSMAYDEKDNWYKYARACGIKPIAVAAEKYLLTLALAVFSFALLIICQIIIGTADTLTAAGFFAINLIIGSLVFPVLFYFGVEKGRLALIVALVAALALSILLMSASGNIAPVMIYAVFCPACLILFALSMLLSAKIHASKDL